MKDKFNTLILLGMLIVIMTAALIPEEHKYLRAIIGLIGATITIFGMIKKNRAQ